MTVQDQPVQATEEQENQVEEEDQSAVSVAMEEEVNIVENYVDGESSYQVRWKRNDVAMKFGT